MKIDRVIIPLNNNSVYTGFWNVFAPVWKNHYNIIPTMIFVGSQSEFDANNFDKSYGDVIRLDPIPEVQDGYPDWSVTWSIIYGASLFNDDICITHGIDQLPLSSYFFDRVNEVQDDKFIVGFGDAYSHYDKNTLGYYNTVTNVMYPSSHLVGKGSLFKDIYEVEESWQSEIKKVYGTREKYILKNKMYTRDSLWGLDECYSSEKISQYEDRSKIVLFDFFWSYWHPKRLDRELGLHNYKCNLIMSGQYSELHAPRPYHRNKIAIDGIIQCLVK